MEINKGDLVFYPLHGVGLLKDRVTRLYEDKEKVYFKVYFEEIKMDIYIPENSAEQQGIRPLTSPEVLEESKSRFFEKFSKLPLLASERKKLLEKKLKSGDIFNITEIIRDLVCAPQYELKLGSQDKSILEAACRLLKNELRYALNISDDKASESLKKSILLLKYK
ncbi:CarD family transcriptional regulator [Paenibacillus sp. ISL-20]|uniref:CarD family transcriptional regulator n=1 Tax=Paenibacillus sp. ISL-20 TaxID=2819163 RepID=UPI001BEA6B0B|nr:CarD family transcriptional regulator [Paenibacillus sp. ISL-20]MBT2765053.1 hypothetical protein [Paenibacillus sp. ISL-20]